MVPFFVKPHKGRNAAIDRGYELTISFYARVAGMYPDLEEGWRYWFFGTYMNFVVVAYIYYVTGYFLANIIALEYKDVELIGMTLCFGSYTYVYGLITAVFYMKRSKIDRLLEMVGNDVFTYERPLTKGEIGIKDAENHKAQIYGRYAMYVPCLTALVQMGIIPAIHGFRGEYTTIVNGSAPLNKYSPLPVWTPVEADSGLSFSILFWFQFIPGLVEFLIIHASCSFFVGNVCVLVSNVKSLRYSLEDINARVMYSYRLRGGTEEENVNIYNNELFQDCFTACLRENILHHIEIIKFHNLFQDIVRYPNFFMFTGAAITISTPPYTILKIAEMGDYNKIFSSGIIMVGHTVLAIFLLSKYCKYGQNFENENEKILDSFYNTPWYKTNREYKQLLLIAMANSQRTLQLKSAVVGISASAATFLDVFKTSYSMLNFLVTAR